MSRSTIAVTTFADSEPSEWNHGATTSPASSRRTVRRAAAAMLLLAAVSSLDVAHADSPDATTAAGSAAVEAPPIDKAVGPAATPVPTDAVGPAAGAAVRSDTSVADGGEIELSAAHAPGAAADSPSATCGSGNGRIDPANDAEYWTVELRTGFMYSLSATRTSGNLDGWLSLYDPNGREVAWDDDSAGGTDPRIDYAPGSSGRWTIRVTSYQARSTGDYRLGVCEDPAATTWPMAPAAPSDLRAEGLSSTEIRLTWRDNSSDETEFRVYGHGLNVGVSANTTSYTVRGLAPNSEICYQVMARNVWGDSAGSNWSCGRTHAATAQCRGERMAFSTPVRAWIDATNRRDYCLDGDTSGPHTVRVYADDDNPWLAIEVYDRNGSPIASAHDRFLVFDGNGRPPYNIAVTHVSGDPTTFSMRAERGRQAGITDGNRDCVVNAADRALMQMSLGDDAPSSSSKRHLDLNMDGIVNMFDWAGWDPTWYAEVGTACR